MCPVPPHAGHGPTDTLEIVMLIAPAPTAIALGVQMDPHLSQSAGRRCSATPRPYCGSAAEVRFSRQDERVRTLTSQVHPVCLCTHTPEGRPTSFPRLVAIRTLQVQTPRSARARAIEI